MPLSATTQESRQPAAGPAPQREKTFFLGRTYSELMPDMDRELGPSPAVNPSAIGLEVKNLGSKEAPQKEARFHLPESSGPLRFKVIQYSESGRGMYEREINEAVGYDEFDVQIKRENGKLQYVVKACKEFTGALKIDTGEGSFTIYTHTVTGASGHQGFEKVASGGTPNQSPLGEKSDGGEKPFHSATSALPGNPVASSTGIERTHPDTLQRIVEKRVETLPDPEAKNPPEIAPGLGPLPKREPEPRMTSPAPPRPGRVKRPAGKLGPSTDNTRVADIPDASGETPEEKKESPGPVVFSLEKTTGESTPLRPAPDIKDAVVIITPDATPPPPMNNDARRDEDLKSGTDGARSELPPPGEAPKSKQPAEIVDASNAVEKIPLLPETAETAAPPPSSPTPTTLPLKKADAGSIVIKIAPPPDVPPPNPEVNPLSPPLPSQKAGHEPPTDASTGTVINIPNRSAAEPTTPADVIVALPDGASLPGVEPGSAGTPVVVITKRDPITPEVKFDPPQEPDRQNDSLPPPLPNNLNLAKSGERKEELPQGEQKEPERRERPLAAAEPPPPEEIGLPDESQDPSEQRWTLLTPPVKSPEKKPSESVPGLTAQAELGPVDELPEPIPGSVFGGMRDSNEPALPDNVTNLPQNLARNKPPIPDPAGAGQVELPEPKPDPLQTALNELENREQNMRRQLDQLGKDLEDALMKGQKEWTRPDVQEALARLAEQQQRFAELNGRDWDSRVASEVVRQTADVIDRSDDSTFSGIMLGRTKDQALGLFGMGKTSTVQPLVARTLNLTRQITEAERQQQRLRQQIKMQEDFRRRYAEGMKKKEKENPDVGGKVIRLPAKPAPAAAGSSDGKK